MTSDDDGMHFTIFTNINPNVSFIFSTSFRPNTMSWQGRRRRCAQALVPVLLLGDGPRGGARLGTQDIQTVVQDRQRCVGGRIAGAFGEAQAPLQDAIWVG